MPLLPQSYVSCRDPSNTQPLRWPQAEYQILGGSTDNEIIFEQRNGIYVFFLAIVDPYYRCVWVDVQG